MGSHGRSIESYQGIVYDLTMCFQKKYTGFYHVFSCIPPTRFMELESSQVKPKKAKGQPFCHDLLAASFSSCG